MSNRRRLLFSGGNIPGKGEAKAGDILCAKEDGSKRIINVTWSNVTTPSYSIPSGWTPIGVVVIPPSHDVYGTGEGAAMSLTDICTFNDYLNAMTPNSYYPHSNNSSENSLRKTIKFTNNQSYNGFNRLGVLDDTYPESVRSTYENEYCGDVYSVISNTCFPTFWQYHGYYVSEYDKLVSYHSMSDVADTKIALPSPYINLTGSVSGGDRNEMYYTSYSSSVKNVFSDFDGYNNTYNNDISKTHLLDFITIGTNNGDWYVPSAGELGYWLARYVWIWKVLNKLPDGNVFNNLPINNTYGAPYWTSTYYNGSCFLFRMYTTNGWLFTTYGHIGIDSYEFGCIRPFIRF